MSNRDIIYNLITFMDGRKGEWSEPLLLKLVVKIVCSVNFKFFNYMFVFIRKKYFIRREY